MPRGPHTDDQGRVDVKSLSLSQLQDKVQELGHKKFRALQIYKWVWQRGATSFAEMTNIAKPLRMGLGEHFYIPFLTEASRKHSEDGTIKFIWACEDGRQIESVFIPDDRRNTLCMSTQVGCAMACSFCLTGDLGLKRQLRPSEIANQPLQVQRTLDALGLDSRITNLVLMGMGEPLHNLPNVIPALEIALDENALNYSHRKVTVSTVGMVHKLPELAAALPVNLAVSLNATTDAQRDEVMPINKRFDLEELLQACRDFPLSSGKRITFEYVMMAGFNDSMEDAVRLEKLMRGLKAKVNLIPYNENPNREIKRPSEDQVKRFQHYLVSRGLNCSVRVTRGKDISAACGQLGKA